MTKTVSFCVDCGLPCLGTSCPNYAHEISVCDKCRGDKPADYRIVGTGEELCEDCFLKFLEMVFEEALKEKSLSADDFFGETAEDELKEIFDQLTIDEKADRLMKGEKIQ